MKIEKLISKKYVKLWACFLENHKNVQNWNNACTLKEIRINQHSTSVIKDQTLLKGVFVTLFRVKLV